MERNYKALKDGLLSKREELRPLTQQSKIVGDYNEAIIREFVVKFIGSNLSARRGLIFDHKGQKSRECDVIIYREKALWEFEDLAIVDEENVRFVMQVKSKLTSKTLKDAIHNLRKVKELNRHLMCWIVGFETEVLLKTLYLNAWRSRGCVQFLHVFSSNRKREDKSLLDSQMEFFLNLLEYYKSGTDSYTDHLQICLKEYKRLVLETGQSEEEVKRILSDVYSKGFRNFQTRR